MASKKPGRKPRGDGPASKVLALRLSPERRAQLEAVVEAMNKKLRAERTPAVVTAASLAAAWIEQQLDSYFEKT
jgi:hypothetical protein